MLKRLLPHWEQFRSMRIDGPHLTGRCSRDANNIPLTAIKKGPAEPKLDRASAAKSREVSIGVERQRSYRLIDPGGGMHYPIFGLARFLAAVVLVVVLKVRIAVDLIQPLDHAGHKPRQDGTRQAWQDR